MRGTKQINDRLLWYSSFYWRIAISFVVFVVVTLVAQSVMFSYVMARSAESMQSPNTLAAIIAGEVRAALARDADLDLSAFLRREFGAVRPDAYVVLKDGRVGASSDHPLDETLKAQALATVNGIDARDLTARSRIEGPVVTAPWSSRRSCADW